MRLYRTHFALLLLACWPVSGAGRAAELPPDLDHACTVAAETGRPILLVFTIDGCESCQNFSADSDDDPDVKRALTQVVSREIPAAHEHAIELSDQFRVRRYPSFVLLTAELAPIDRWTGYARSTFLADLNRALSDLTPIEAKRRQLEERPTAELARELGDYDFADEAYRDAVASYRRAGALAGSEDLTLPIFEAIAAGYRDQEFSRAELDAAADGFCRAARLSR
ncbi:MAG: thioredoxin family protein [Candidatus Eisenbacteria bacterium]